PMPGGATLFEFKVRNNGTALATNVVAYEACHYEFGQDITLPSIVSLGNIKAGETRILAALCPWHVGTGQGYSQSADRFTVTVTTPDEMDSSDNSLTMLG